jgi:outer membrane protein TolC
MKGAMMILLLVLPWARAGAQLSLEACQEKARANYPLAREHALIERAMAFDLINANRGYLPRLSVSARATYQSGVTRLPVNLPGIDIKELSRDQYQAAVEVTQVLWDGGEIAARKRAVETAAATRRHQVEVDLHALRERVNQLFFGVLLADEQLKQNRLLQEESRRALEQVEALAGQGIASASDVDAARVMQVQARQREAEIRAARDAYREMLGLLAGEEVGEL